MNNNKIVSNFIKKIDIFFFIIMITKYNNIKRT